MQYHHMLPAMPTVMDANPTPHQEVESIEMYNTEESQPLVLTAVPPHLPDLPLAECGSDLPSVQMEQPPQRHPRELSFIINAVETPTMPLTGLIQFALPIGCEDLEGEDPEDLYKPLWMDQQKMTNAKEILTAFLKQKHNQLNIVYTKRLYTMLAMLNFYLDVEGKLGWRGASMMASMAAGHGLSLAHKVRQWTLCWVASNYNH